MRSGSSTLQRLNICHNFYSFHVRHSVSFNTQCRRPNTTATLISFSPRFTIHPPLFHHLPTLIKSVHLFLCFILFSSFRAISNALWSTVTNRRAESWSSDQFKVNDRRIHQWWPFYAHIFGALW